MKNTKNTVTIVTIGAIAALASGYFIYMNSTSSGPTKLSPFATCLKNKGTLFYGAFWCTHCQNQKKMFGNAANNLPYVECSNPDQSENALCNQKGIQGYPTWIFPDGSRLTGEVPLQTLADKSGCTLPISK